MGSNEVWGRFLIHNFEGRWWKEVSQEGTNFNELTPLDTIKGVLAI